MDINNEAQRLKTFSVKENISMISITFMGITITFTAAKAAASVGTAAYSLMKAAPLLIF